MSYFQQQNPWLSMAQYGRGLGDVLGQYITELPRLRAQMVMQQAQLPGHLALQQAQLGEAQTRTKLLGEQAQAYPEIQRQKMETEKAHKGLYESQGKYYEERGKAAGQPKPPQLKSVAPGHTLGVVDDAGEFHQKYTAPEKTMLDKPLNAIQLLNALSGLVGHYGKIADSSIGPAWDTSAYQQSPMYQDATNKIAQVNQAISAVLPRLLGTNTPPAMSITPQRRFRFDPATGDLIPVQ